MRSFTSEHPERKSNPFLTLALCALLLLSPHSIAMEKEPDTARSWQQFLNNLEALAKPLGKNSKDYIDCLEQQPEWRNNPKDIARLPEQIGSAGKTCQFLLDDLLQQYQQIIDQQSSPPPENSI